LKSLRKSIGNPIQGTNSQEYEGRGRVRDNQMRESFSRGKIVRLLEERDKES
jgi:hypothetical protein